MWWCERRCMALYFIHVAYARLSHSKIRLDTLKVPTWFILQREKARTKSENCCVYLLHFIHANSPYCVHTPISKEGKFLCLIFFRTLDIVSPDAFLLCLLGLRKFGTHTNFIISYSLPSYKLKNYYDFRGSCSGEWDWGSCFIYLLKFFAPENDDINTSDKVFGGINLVSAIKTQKNKNSTYPCARPLSLLSFSCLLLLNVDMLLFADDTMNSNLVS